MSTCIKIIGVGSPFGDDRLGWVAAEQLKASPILLSEKDKIDISILDRPGAALLSKWQDADAVILIDAVRSGATPGTLHILATEDIDANTQLTSSHGFGIAATMALARTLEELPENLYLYGIEIDPTPAGDDLGLSASEALRLLVDRIEKLVISLLQSLPATTNTNS